MAASQPFEGLLDQADQSVRKTLEYLEGPGATSEVRVDRWGVREVAAHLLHWHRVTTEAALAAARNEPPLRFTSHVDEINEEAVGRCAGMTVADIVTELKQAHREMFQAIRSLPDADVVLIHRADGTSPTAKDRLQTIAHHWIEHLNELQAQQ